MDNACKEYNISWDFSKYSFGFSFTFKRKSQFNYSYSDILSRDAKKLLNFMREDDGILENSMTAMKILNKKDRSTYKVIKELIDNNLIERIGSNKTGYWKVKNGGDKNER